MKQQPVQWGVWLGGVLGTGVLLLAPAASAQDLTYRDLGLVEVQALSLDSIIKLPAGSVAVAFGSPIGFGYNSRDIAVVVGGEESTDVADDDLDGSLGVGFGFGDSESAIAVETVVNVISLRNNFGDDGNVNMKVHTRILPTTGVAVGVENIWPWGDAGKVSESGYAVITHIIDVPVQKQGRSMPISLNFGVGNERFADPDEEGLMVFGGVGVGLHPQFSVVLDWTGRTLNAGASWLPIRDVPFSLTAGFINVTDRLNDFDNGPRFAASAGYLFRW